MQSRIQGVVVRVMHEGRFDVDGLPEPADEASFACFDHASLCYTLIFELGSDRRDSFKLYHS